MTNHLDRRSFLTSAGVAALAACAPGSSPSGPAADGGGSAEWERRWADLAQAAKQEGQLRLVMPLGTEYPKAIELFEKAFPGVAVDTSQIEATKFAPKAFSEADSGVHLYDVLVTSHATAGPSLYIKGLMEPIRPVIFRPDVTGDQNWRDGFEAGFLDESKQFTYNAFAFANYSVWINTDMVQEGEIKTVDDMLNPKWKSRIVSGDPRANGAGSVPATALRQKYGDDIIRRLWKDQDVTLTRDLRQLVELMVRGRYAIGIGLSNTVIEQFWSEGLGKSVKWIIVPPMMSASGGQDVIYLFKRRSHPNAAALFINWFLAKEGQTAWAQAAVNNSRRSDVEPLKPDQLPRPDLEYFHNDDWRNIEPITETYQLAQKILT